MQRLLTTVYTVESNTSLQVKEKGHINCMLLLTFSSTVKIVIALSGRIALVM